MVFKKSILKKLKRELDNYNIRSKAILQVASEKGKSSELVRLVLNGEVSDNNDIIIGLFSILEEEKNKIIEISNKIESI